MEEKRISVCMATFNGAKYVRQQIESILVQLGESDEIVVSDDSSTDNTIEVIQSINDKRIRLLTGMHFRNPVYNFEHALGQAKGEYIFLSDQDDIWLDGKIDAVMTAFNKADVVVTDCKIVDDNLNIITESYFAFKKSRRGLIRNLLSNTYLGCCMAFRRKILDKALPFPDKLPMHDIWLGFISELFYECTFLHEPYILHRRHLANSSSVSERSEATLWQKIGFRWNTIKHWPAVLLRK
ncbi:MAG: glycosyltransferase family 2 protein [Bacteroidota bacterium]